MIEEILKELEELIQYKRKYEYAISDKQKLSDKVYEYEKEKFDKLTPEERVLKYKKDNCTRCRFGDLCNMTLPHDIGMPVKSDLGYFPPTKMCGEFEWN